MPTPRDQLRRQVHDVVHRHLIRPAGGFRAHELVDDLVEQLQPGGERVCSGSAGSCDGDPTCPVACPTPAVDDLANARRLAWFTDDELRAELHRRATELRAGEPR